MGFFLMENDENRIRTQLISSGLVSRFVSQLCGRVPSSTNSQLMRTARLLMMANCVLLIGERISSAIIRAAQTSKFHGDPAPKTQCLKTLTKLFESTVTIRTIEDDSSEIEMLECATRNLPLESTRTHY